jgi:hypothetical protein
MERATDVIPRAIEPRQETSSPTPPGRVQLINQLFATLSVTYPSFLRADQRPDDLKRMWAAHLEEFSEARIEQAARKMVDQHATFPPTIGEFKALCNQGWERPEHRLVPPRARIDYDRDKSVGLAALANLKEIVRQECEV